MHDSEAVLPCPRLVDSIPDESFPLILPSPKKTKEIPPLLSVAMYGFWNVSVAIFIISSSEFVSLIDSSAAGIVGPYQSVILAAGLGFTLSTGILVGTPIAKGKFSEAGDIEKSGLLIASGIGTITTAAMFSLRGILPLLFESNIAKVAVEYFTAAAIGVIPLTILQNDVQFSFQAGHWLVPPIVGASLLAVSLPLSYVLGFVANQGSFGIGLGNSIAALLACVALRIFFLISKNYDKYHLHRFPERSTFKEKFKRSSIEGFKLALQRITEWANLAITADVVGANGNSRALEAINPIFEILRLIGAIFQGIAQSTGMIVSKNISKFYSAIDEAKDKDLALQLYQATRRSIIYSALFAFGLAGGLNILFYLIRQPLTSFFIHDNTQDIQDFAQTLLWIGMLGLLPNSFRVVMTGALRGWKDFVVPMLISLVAMIGVAIPVGFGFSKTVDNGVGVTSEAAFMLYIRAAVILGTAVMLTARCARQLSQDKQRIDNISGELNEQELLTENINTLPDEEESSASRQNVSSFWRAAPTLPAREPVPMSVHGRSCTIF